MLCLPTFVQDALTETDITDLETLADQVDEIMAHPRPQGSKVCNATLDSSELADLQGDLLDINHVYRQETRRLTSQRQPLSEREGESVSTTAASAWPHANAVHHVPGTWKSPTRLQVQGSASTVLQVEDPSDSVSYLVDTSTEVSILPHIGPLPACSSDSPALYAANRTRISTYESHTQVLHLSSHFHCTIPPGRCAVTSVGRRLPRRPQAACQRLRTAPPAALPELVHSLHPMQRAFLQPFPGECS